MTSQDDHESRCAQLTALQERMDVVRAAQSLVLTLPVLCTPTMLQLLYDETAAIQDELTEISADTGVYLPPVHNLN